MVQTIVKAGGYRKGKWQTAVGQSRSQRWLRRAPVVDLIGQGRLVRMYRYQCWIESERGERGGENVRNVCPYYDTAGTWP